MFQHNANDTTNSPSEPSEIEIDESLAYTVTALDMKSLDPNKSLTDSIIANCYDSMECQDTAFLSPLSTNLMQQLECEDYHKYFDNLELINKSFVFCAIKNSAILPTQPNHWYLLLWQKSNSTFHFIDAHYALSNDSIASTTQIGKFCKKFSAYVNVIDYKIQDANYTSDTTNGDADSGIHVLLITHCIVLQIIESGSRNNFRYFTLDELNSSREKMKCLFQINFYNTNVNKKHRRKKWIRRPPKFKF